jgi:hypothetical protein
MTVATTTGHAVQVQLARDGDVETVVCVPIKVNGVPWDLTVRVPERHDLGSDVPVELEFP